MLQTNGITQFALFLKVSLLLHLFLKFISQLLFGFSCILLVTTCASELVFDVLSLEAPTEVLFVNLDGIFLFVLARFRWSNDAADVDLLLVEKLLYAVETELGVKDVLTGPNQVEQNPTDLIEVKQDLGRRDEVKELTTTHNEGENDCCHDVGDDREW